MFWSLAVRLDEWGHEHGLIVVNNHWLGWWRRPWLAPFRILCDWTDRQYMKGAH